MNLLKLAVIVKVMDHFHHARTFIISAHTLKKILIIQCTTINVEKYKNTKKKLKKKKNRILINFKKWFLIG